MRAACAQKQILSDHFGVDAAKIDLGFEFSRHQVGRLAIEAEQPKREIAVDVGDLDFTRSALLLRGPARGLRLAAMLRIGGCAFEQPEDG